MRYSGAREQKYLWCKKLVSPLKRVSRFFFGESQAFLAFGGDHFRQKRRRELCAYMKYMTAQRDFLKFFTYAPEFFFLLRSLKVS